MLAQVPIVAGSSSDAPAMKPGPRICNSRRKRPGGWCASRLPPVEAALAPGGSWAMRFLGGWMFRWQKEGANDVPRSAEPRTERVFEHAAPASAPVPHLLALRARALRALIALRCVRGSATRFAGVRSER